MRDAKSTFLTMKSMTIKSVIHLLDRSFGLLEICICNAEYTAFKSVSLTTKAITDQPSSDPLNCVLCFLEVCSLEQSLDRTAELRGGKSMRNPK